jgi:cytoskeletal protein RodZ
MDSEPTHYENIRDIIYTPTTHLRVESKADNHEDKSSLPVRSSPKRPKKKILLVVIPIVLLIIVGAGLIGFFVLQATTKNTELVKFRICFHYKVQAPRNSSEFFLPFFTSFDRVNVADHEKQPFTSRKYLFHIEKDEKVEGCDIFQKTHFFQNITSFDFFVVFDMKKIFA